MGGHGDAAHGAVEVDRVEVEVTGPRDRPELGVDPHLRYERRIGQRCENPRERRDDRREIDVPLDAIVKAKVHGVPTSVRDGDDVLNAVQRHGLMLLQRSDGRRGVRAPRIPQAFPVRPELGGVKRRPREHETARARTQGL